MIELQLDVEGVYAFVKSPDYKRKLRTAVRKAARAEAAAYNSGTGSPSLRDRFRADAFSRFGFTPRTAAYERRQQKLFGRVLPYRSPTTHGTFGKGHFADRVVKPGSGHRITMKNGTDEVRTKMTYPAARVLNLIRGAPGRTYRKEFLDFRRGEQRRHARAINQGIGDRFAKLRDELFAREEKRSIRGRARLQRLIGK